VTLATTREQISHIEKTNFAHREREVTVGGLEKAQVEGGRERKRRGVRHEKDSNLVESRLVP